MFVLDFDHKRLRKTFVVDEDGRADFWEKMTAAAEKKKVLKKAEKKGAEPLRGLQSPSSIAMP